MEYFDGATLSDYVKERGCVKPKDMLSLSRLIAEGLAEAHRRGVIHRDVKPANLLVNRRGGVWQVKIIDFGLALTDTNLHATVSTPGPSARLTSSYEFAGTIDYAAPEQMGRLPGVAVGRPADIYAFGKTCCYALFGTPNPINRHWASLPKPLAKWLDCCLEENPQERFADFDVTLKGLEGVKIRKERHEAVVIAADLGCPPVKSDTLPQFRPVLVVLRGQSVKVEYELQEGKNVIGRDGADFDLTEQEVEERRLVSRQHCIVSVEDGSLSVEDNGSSNGTFLNRSRIRAGARHPLNPEDQIQLGSVVLKVQVR